MLNVTITEHKHVVQVTPEAEEGGWLKNTISRPLGNIASRLYLKGNQTAGNGWVALCQEDFRDPLKMEGGDLQDGAYY